MQQELLELAMKAFIEKGESYDEQFELPLAVLPAFGDCVDASDRFVNYYLILKIL